MRQGFHRIGSGGLIVELVERPEVPDGPAAFWGIVINVDDLDVACDADRRRSDLTAEGRRAARPSHRHDPQRGRPRPARRPHDPLSPLRRRARSTRPAPIIDIASAAVATSCARALPVRGSELGPGGMTIAAGRVVDGVVAVDVVDVVGVVDVVVDVGVVVGAVAVVVAGGVVVVGGAALIVWARSSQSSCAAISESSIRRCSKATNTPAPGSSPPGTSTVPDDSVGSNSTLARTSVGTHVPSARRSWRVISNR